MVPPGFLEAACINTLICTLTVIFIYLSSIYHRLLTQKSSCNLDRVRSVSVRLPETGLFVISPLDSMVQLSEVSNASWQAAIFL